MRLRASILIQRPIAAVFAYVSRPDYLPSWVTGVVTAEGAGPERQGVGALLVVGRPGAGGLVRSTWEVIAYEPPRMLALRALDDRAGVEVSWALERASSGATRVSVEADMLAIGFFGSQPGYLEESILRQLQADLEVLRRCVGEEA
jgi:uncharacterized protein YndB with AHSA1/START domain